MEKVKSNKRRVAIAVVLAGAAGLISVYAWAQTESASEIESPQIRYFSGVNPSGAPHGVYHENSQTMAVPSLEDGVLYLSEVDKSSGAISSRKQIASDVYRLAEFNPATGQFLYQTIEGNTPTESAKDVVTWLGSRSGETRRVYKGAGEVSISPSGNYLALTDYNGHLRITDQDGNELVRIENANRPVFSADESKLAFFRGVMYGPDDSKGLAVIDFQSGSLIAEYAPDTGEYPPLAFSSHENLLFTAGNRRGQVDLMELVLSQEERTFVVTKREQGLPYISGYNATYVASEDRVYLAIENRVLSVDLSTGEVEVTENIKNPLWIGSDGKFIAQTDSANSWKVVDLSK